MRRFIIGGGWLADGQRMPRARWRPNYPLLTGLLIGLRASNMRAA